MKRLVYIVLGLALAAGMWSCGGGAVKMALDEADSLMETAPERSLEILDSVAEADSTRNVLRGKDVKARHAMLLTQARYKCYIYETNDSLIGTAVAYYGEHGSKRDLMRSLFYDGVVKYNAGDTEGSVVALLEAYDLAQETGEPLWIARTAEMLADNYANARLSGEEVKMRRIAVDNYDKAGRDLNAFYSRLDLAIGYEVGGMLDSALNLANRIVTGISKDEYDNIYLRVLMYKSLLSSYELNERYDVAKSLVDSILKYQDEVNLTADDYVALTRVMLHFKDAKGVKAALDSAQRRITNSDETIEYFQSLNDYTRLTTGADTQPNYVDSIAKGMLDAIHELAGTSISKVERVYNEQKIERQKTEYNKSKRRLMLLCAALAIMIAAGVIIYRIRVKRMRIDLLKKAELADELGATIARLTTEIEESDIVNVKVKHYKDLLDKLRSQLTLFVNVSSAAGYGESLTNNEEFKELIKQMKEKVKEMSQPKFMESFMDFVDSMGHGIITELRERVPSLKSRDIKILAFIYAGFSRVEISGIFGLRYSNYYTVTSRIHQRIIDEIGLNKEDKERYINFRI